MPAARRSTSRRRPHRLPGFLRLGVGDVEADGPNVLVDALLQVRQEFVAERQALVEPAADSRDTLLDGFDPPEENRPTLCEPARVAIVTAVVSQTRVDCT